MLHGSAVMLAASAKSVLGSNNASLVSTSGGTCHSRGAIADHPSLPATKTTQNNATNDLFPSNVPLSSNSKRKYCIGPFFS